MSPWVLRNSRPSRQKVIYINTDSYEQVITVKKMHLNIMIIVTKQYFDSCFLSTIHTWKRYLTFMDIT